MQLHENKVQPFPEFITYLFKMACPGKTKMLMQFYARHIICIYTRDKRMQLLFFSGSKQRRVKQFGYAHPSVLRVNINGNLHRIFISSPGPEMAISTESQYC